ncbi:metallophosphoesterase family protein [Paenibacillus sp. PL91]|uniref:metallophosphoesterase family protein n=1 Tax=Paenibacillus sp. PL91 TaxID=2729538 RepID=UPI00145C98DB|nr:metallophosphoesterase family protein [Paenibacillus sp. PL91]MBC9200786.1 metallophosphoesterase family protein [Paenibacillus sp. PL91]
MDKALRFRTDGTFKIVQFSDTEYMDDAAELNERTAKMIRTVIQAELPDLVVFAGDVIGSLRCSNPEQSFRNAVSTVEELKIPWAAVFGNHDSEAGITREQLMDLQLSHNYCVAEQTAEHVSGVGNYALKIIGNDGERAAAALYFLDSGSYSPLPQVSGYDWIRRDQIDWYAAQSKAFRDVNGGQPLPSLAFFHIPLPEYQDVWDKAVCYGEKREEVTCPRVNSGLFAAMAEMGDVMGTFAGHDHGNDYWGELYGIRLCYGRSSSYMVWDTDIPIGARVIELTQGSRTFETWLRLFDASTLHDQRTRATKKRSS